MIFKTLKNKRITPSQIIILGFLALILAGTVLLMLPFATQDGHGAPLLDALFTATSATCVTGLVVQDTASYWSAFGQGVILVLIQIGGLGVVTMGITIAMVTGRRIGLKQRWVMQESISAPQMGGILRQTRFILRAVLGIELTGAVLLLGPFIRQFGPLRGVWYAVFHSISAFCNAGFDLMGIREPFSSLTTLGGSVPVALTLSALIIVGGLGFFTWRDLYDNRLRWKRYTLQTKLVLVTTAVLLLGGFVFFLYEFSQPQWRHLSAGRRVLEAWFQSVTTRTAGFNMADLTAMDPAAQLVTILLMLVGGSPGSTAGGFKTTTLAVLVLGTRAVFRHRSSAQCFGRRISDETLRNASALLTLYVGLFLGGGLLICCIDGVPLMGALFESASAVGTVGLSLGLTPGLSTVSHLILIFLMVFGRVGGLTMIYAVTSGAAPERSQWPQERVSVG